LIEVGRFEGDTVGKGKGTDEGKAKVGAKVGNIVGPADGLLVGNAVLGLYVGKFGFKLYTTLP
jgi:hypothetical protein